MPSSQTRAEVSIILRRLVKAGVILGSRTNLGRESSDAIEEIQVTVFVGPEADHNAVRDAVQNALEPVPERVVVTVRAGTRSSETPRRGDESTAVRRQREITVYGCVLAVVVAVLIGMYLPELGRLIGIVR